jgi:hypothetical protein
VLPATVLAPIDKAVPVHMVELVIVAAAGAGFNVIINELVFVQPFELVSVSV